MIKMENRTKENLTSQQDNNNAWLLTDEQIKLLNRLFENGVIILDD